jgi:Ca2+-binding RTX toxin-like protein
VGLDSAEAVIGGSGDDTLAIAVGSANITVGSTDLLGLSSIKTIDIDNVNSQTASITLTDAVYTANGTTTLAVTNSGTGTDDGITVTASALSSANSVQFTGASATAANENVVGGAGDDTFTFSTAGVATGYDANDTVNGGAGTDTLVISTGTTALTAATLTNVSNIEAITVSGTTGGVGTLTLVDGNFVSITGATVSASALTTGVLLFTAAAEDDSTFNITGGAGADNIVGGQLADTISGGSGADTITGGLKADVLSGGAGADTFVFATTAQSSGSNTDSISDFVSGSDKLNVTLDYSGINSGLTVDATVQTARAGTALIQENLSGSRGQSTYDTTGSALYINVNSDNLLTTSDYKIAINPAATATATIAEGDINFAITGGTGADTITAGGGADTIVAGSGADVITAGAGNDTITLNADSTKDTMVMAATNALNGVDTIGGFEVGAGADLIDFTAATATGYLEVTSNAGTLDTSATGMLILDYDVGTAAAAMTAAQLYAASSTGGSTAGNAAETVYIATTTDATNAASVFVFKATMNATSNGFSGIDHMVTLTGITDLSSSDTTNWNVA